MKNGRHRAILAALPPGFRLIKAGNEHLAIVDAAGAPLRSESGLPIRVSASPSDHRTQKNEVSRIRRAVRCL